MLKMKSGNPNFISLPYPRTRHNGRIQTVTSGVTDHHSITDWAIPITSFAGWERGLKVGRGGRGIKELPSTVSWWVPGGKGDYLFIRESWEAGAVPGWEGSGDPHRCLWERDSKRFGIEVSLSGHLLACLLDKYQRRRQGVKEDPKGSLSLTRIESVPISRYFLIRWGERIPKSKTSSLSITDRNKWRPGWVVPIHSFHLVVVHDGITIFPLLIVK